MIATYCRIGWKAWSPGSGTASLTANTAKRRRARQLRETRRYGFGKVGTHWVGMQPGELTSSGHADQGSRYLSTGNFNLLSLEVEY